MYWQESLKFACVFVVCCLEEKKIVMPLGRVVKLCRLLGMFVMLVESFSVVIFVNV